MSLRISTKFILAESSLSINDSAYDLTSMGADLIGHSTKTIEELYLNMKLKDMDSELIQMRKNNLESGDFQTLR